MDTHYLNTTILSLQGETTKALALVKRNEGICTGYGDVIMQSYDHQNSREEKLLKQILRNCQGLEQALKTYAQRDHRWLYQGVQLIGQSINRWISLPIKPDQAADWLYYPPIPEEICLWNDQVTLIEKRLNTLFQEMQKRSEELKSPAKVRFAAEDAVPPAEDDQSPA